MAARCCASRASSARDTSCPELGRVTELFIREEQHHAAQLREFMLAHGIALKQRNWTDSVFRQIRRSPDFEPRCQPRPRRWCGSCTTGLARPHATCAPAAGRMCADEAIHLRYERSCSTLMASYAVQLRRDGRRPARWRTARARDRRAPCSCFERCVMATLRWLCLASCRHRAAAHMRTASAGRIAAAVTVIREWSSIAASGSRAVARNAATAAQPKLILASRFERESAFSSASSSSMRFCL